MWQIAASVPCLSWPFSVLYGTIHAQGVIIPDLRLYGVLDSQLEGREYIWGYSIADGLLALGCDLQKQNIDLHEFKNVRRWA